MMSHAAAGFYTPTALHSMWNNSFPTSNTTSVAASMTPTSSTTSAPSPPVSRSYEAASSSPEPVQSYGYPPTPPKEVKAEESYSYGSALGGSATSTTSVAENFAKSDSSSFSYQNDLGSPLYGSYSTTGILSTASSRFQMQQQKKSSSKSNNKAGHSHSGKTLKKLQQSLFQVLKLFCCSFLQTVVNAWIVARHQLLYGDEMATAIICAMLVDFTTKWMAPTGPLSSPSASWYVVLY